MYDGDRHRPLEQWFRLNESSTSVFVDDSAFELRLERNALEKFTPKVGGFGVVYHCDAVPMKGKVPQKAVIKHMHYDGSRDESQLPQLNADLDHEIALIRRVEALNLTPHCWLNSRLRPTRALIHTECFSNTLPRERHCLT